jgi:MraZ protein
MFLGEYAHTIDEKGRLTVPSKYRHYLDGGMVVTRGLDRCIAVYPMDTWKALVEKITALPSTPRPAREYSRLIFSAASDLQADRQGRILIPSVLYNYAEIDSEAAIIGMNDRFDIWNPRIWAEYKALMEKDAEFIADKLAELGIAI